MVFRLLVSTIVIWSGISQILVAVSANLPSESIKKTLEDAVSAFGVKFSQLLGDEPKGRNILFSPLNIFSALMTLHLGAEGATKDELADIIGLPKDPATVSQAHEHFGEILKSIQTTKSATINVASGVFLKRGFDLNKDYVDEAKKNYDGEVRTLDFGTKDATDFVNGWISNKTNNRIAKFYKLPLPASTELLLTNTFYFAASWSEKFSKKETAWERFKIGSVNIDLHLMKQKKLVPYTDNPNLKFRAIGIPYQSNQTIMFIVLPYQNQSLADTIKELRPQQFFEIVNDAENNETRVEYKIPRTRLRWSDNLNHKLVTMGCEKLFTNPDLSKMVASSLKVSSVTHVTDMETNEDGIVVAAAAPAASTVIEFTTKGVVNHSGLPVPFYVNRPYLSFIYHRRTKMILFTGIIYHPATINHYEYRTFFGERLYYPMFDYV